MHIIVNEKLFRAVAVAVSTEETRYYLNGVHICAHPDGGAYLVATDGHRMLVGYDEGATFDWPGSDSVIVRPDKKLLAAAKTDRRSDAQNQIAVEGATVKVLEGSPATVAATFAGLLIDGTFPDWRRVIPTVDKNEHAACQCFNARYLADFGTAARVMTGQKEAFISVLANDEHSPALVDLGVPNLFGVLTPARKGSDPALPAWLK